MAMKKWDTTDPTLIVSRLNQGKSMQTSTSSAEVNFSSAMFDYNNGWSSNATGANTTLHSWMWKRAKGFMDVVAFDGNGTSGRTVAHSLSVIPELMICKRRSSTEDWTVYNSTSGATHFLNLNNADAANTAGNVWNDTAPTSTVFSVGNSSRVNSSGHTYIAYLFATLDGISKVGSFVGNGTSQNIDCGFSAGARFVLLKNTSAAHGWHLFDTTRGIVAGNDPYLLLNTNAGQYTNLDMIDPHNSGFTVLDHGEINGNGNTIIFYAIA